MTHAITDRPHCYADAVGLSEYGRFFSVSYLYLKIMSYLWKININQFNFIMITNREEVLENALRVFAKMNYEKASQVEIGKACGLTKAGLVYYYPIKLDLFVAVIDKYVFGMQSVANKFRFKAATLSEFIEQYIKGVEQTMRKLISLLDDGNNPAGCSFNFYYYHLMMQVRLYYPDVEEKICRHVPAGLRVLESRHTVGKGHRGDTAGCGHRGHSHAVPAGVFRSVL